jgi:hypothetical protein
LGITLQVHLGGGDGADRITPTTATAAPAPRTITCLIPSPKHRTGDVGDGLDIDTVRIVDVDAGEGRGFGRSAKLETLYALMVTDADTCAGFAAFLQCLATELTAGRARLVAAPAPA